MCWPEREGKQEQSSLPGEGTTIPTAQGLLKYHSNNTICSDMCHSGKLSVWIEEMAQSLKRLLCELGDLDSADWNPCLKSWWVGNALTLLLKWAKTETGGFLKLIGQTAKLNQ